MKVIKKSKMPDGTNIQIEDWKNSYNPTEVYTIGTYPKAKNTSKRGFIVSNEKFRLALTNFESDDEVEKIFNELEKGMRTLDTLSEHFYNGHRDMYYFGMVEDEEIEEEQEDMEI